MLGLFLEVALGDEEGKVRVDVARRLEAVVEVALDALPDRVPVGTNGERAPHWTVVGELGHPDEIQVPLARVLALLGQLLDRLGHTDAPLSMRIRIDESIASETRRPTAVARVLCANAAQGRSAAAQGTTFVEL